MIRYGDPPSNQSQLDLPGLSDWGQKTMEEARHWVAVHYDEFMWYKRLARGKNSQGSKASPNFCLQSMREHFRIEIPNAYAPCLARIAMEDDKRLEFRLAKSKVDGFTTARL